MRSCRPTRRRCAERGQVGGLEAIVFGVLVFVGGILLTGSVWGVVDTKLTVTAAAREAVRELVESEHTTTAVSRARDRAAQVLREHGRRPERATVEVAGSLQRCDLVVVEVSYPVPGIALPGGGVGPTVVVRARHAERMDPYRSGPAGAARCPGS